MPRVVQLLCSVAAASASSDGALRGSAPSLPFPAGAFGPCEDGYLFEMLPKDECPGLSQIPALGRCSSASPGELCEADGECGLPELDNCDFRAEACGQPPADNCDFRFDVFRKLKSKSEFACFNPNPGQPLPRTVATVAIFGGVTTDRRYLSRGDDFDVNLDVQPQRWVFERDPSEGWYHITLLGARLGEPRFLSVSEAGTNVQLSREDDGTGRQRWILTAGFQTPPPCCQGSECDTGAWTQIQVFRGRGAVLHSNGFLREYLSVNSEGTVADPWWRDDGSGRQRWVISAVPEAGKV